MFGKRRRAISLIAASAGPRPAPGGGRVISTEDVSATPALGMFLLAVLTLLVFVRPGDINPEFFEGLALFKWIAIPTFLVCMRHIPERTTQDALRQSPILLCFLGFFFAVIWSGLTHFSVWFARQGLSKFAVIAVYFMIMITVVDTPKRLLTFLRTVVVSITFLVIIVMVDYLDIFALLPIDPLTKLSVTKLLQSDGIRLDGEMQFVSRMRGIGIFKDPNDLSQIIVLAGLICAYLSRLTHLGVRRFLWLIPIFTIYVPALLLTKSRGGLLAAGVSVITVLAVHYGRRAIIAASLLGIMGLVAMGGRQASISVSEGTGHSRLLLWRDGFVAVQGKDLIFGIGYSRYADIAGLQAHNSFVHAFIETGLFGGTLYFGCFLFALISLTRMKQAGIDHLDERLKQFHPFCAAIVMAWCIGMTTLSRNYAIPTYIIIGIALSFITICQPRLRPPQLLAYWDRRHMGSLLKASALCFLLFYGMVRVFAR